MLGECFNKIGLDYPLKSFEYPDIKADSDFQNFLSSLKFTSDDELFALSFESEANRGETEKKLSSIEKSVVRRVSNPLHRANSRDIELSPMRKSVVQRVSNPLQRAESC